MHLERVSNTFWWILNFKIFQKFRITDAFHNNSTRIRRKEWGVTDVDAALSFCRGQITRLAREN